MGEAKRRKLSGDHPTQKIRENLQAETSTDAGMATFMNALVGPGNWTFDKDEDVWVTPDKNHRGPGRGFLVVRRGGSWFKSVLPDAINLS